MTTDTGYEPNLTVLAEQIANGEPVHRDVVLWNIGRYHANHPIYLLAYHRTGDPKALAPEGSGLRFYDARKSGIEFRDWAWRPMKDDERNLHSVNGGCPSCFRDDEQSIAGQGITQREQFEERTKRTGSCKDPQIHHFTAVLKIRWTEVARFVKPAITPDRVERMTEFMKRRTEFAMNKDVSYRAIFEDPEAHEAWRIKQAEQTRQWNLLEDEGHALGNEVWDAAHATAIGERLGLSI